MVLDHFSEVRPITVRREAPYDKKKQVKLVKINNKKDNYKTLNITLISKKKCLKTSQYITLTRAITKHNMLSVC